MEGGYLIRRQEAPLARREVAQHQRPLSHPYQPLDLVSKELGDFADMPFAPFVYDHPHPRSALHPPSCRPTRLYLS